MKALPYVFFAACAHLPAPDVPLRLALRDTSHAVVVIVKVRPPWYALRALIVKKFRDAVPEYLAAPGLERKQFSFAADGAFGGVYLWTKRVDAEAWFGSAWHERVRRQRGVDGDVRFIDVTSALDGPVAQSVFEGPMVVALTHDTLPRYRGATGLRAAYANDALVVSTWQNRASANAFLAHKDDVEWFDTPIGIVKP